MLTSTSGNTVTNLGNDSTNGVLTFAGPVDSVTLDGNSMAHTGKFATVGSNSTVTFTSVVIGSHGTVEVGSTGKLDLDSFTSYGNLKVDNGTSSSPLSALTLVVNTGSSAAGVSRRRGGHLDAGAIELAVFRV